MLMKNAKNFLFLFVLMLSVSFGYTSAHALDVENKASY